jgi:peroxiredoxin
MPSTRFVRTQPAGLALAATCLLATGLAGAGESASAAFLGQEAPAFTLADPGGESHSLADLSGGKGTVIIWISTKCPVSNAYNGRMASLTGKYEPQGFRFVGINSNSTEDTAEIASHAGENGLGFTILRDEGNVIADKYGASVTPEVYVLDPQGILIYHGRIDDSMKVSDVKSKDLEMALDAILAGKPVPKGESKAFGCSIKRAE